jgi:hypothetical protein
MKKECLIGWNASHRLAFSGDAGRAYAERGYTIGRNLEGNVSRVDYFGGATFATNEHASKNNGVSFGNFINTNITDEITGNFDNYVITHPMYMHEYGHYIDSQYWGLAYLFGIGIPSGISAAGSDRPIVEWDGEYVNNLHNLTKHNVYWTETRANRRAAKYFRKYYGVTWSGNNFDRLPLENPFNK